MGAPRVRPRDIQSKSFMVSPMASRRRLSLATATLCLRSSGTVSPAFIGMDISQNRVPSSVAKLNLNRVSDILPIFRTGLPVASVAIETPRPRLCAKLGAELRRVVPSSSANKFKLRHQLSFRYAFFSRLAFTADDATAHFLWLSNLCSNTNFSGVPIAPYSVIAPV